MPATRGDYATVEDIPTVLGHFGDVTESPNEIGNINPFRYRGYYYDAEIAKYYLQSRYYDPVTGRFVNGDEAGFSLLSTSVVSHNLFGYCANDAVNKFDDSGHYSLNAFWQFVNSLPLVAIGTCAAGFSWDQEQGIWYSNMYPIQRQLGYCDLYDTLAPLAGIFIQRKKMPFNYDGKSWMIWIWKGTYGITTGAEIGLYIYSKTISATAFGKKYTQRWYRCAKDSERIKMAFVFYKNGKKLFAREYQTHWWLTGFKPGISRRRDNLSMYITLGFHDLEMARSFCSANGLRKPSSPKVSFWW